MDQRLRVDIRPSKQKSSTTPHHTSRPLPPIPLGLPSSNLYSSPSVFRKPSMDQTHPRFPPAPNIRKTCNTTETSTKEVCDSRHPFGLKSLLSGVSAAISSWGFGDFAFLATCQCVQIFEVPPHSIDGA